MSLSLAHNNCSPHMRLCVVFSSVRGICVQLKWKRHNLLHIVSLKYFEYFVESYDLFFEQITYSSCSGWKSPWIRLLCLQTQMICSCLHTVCTGGDPTSLGVWHASYRVSAITGRGTGYHSWITDGWIVLVRRFPKSLVDRESWFWPLPHLRL